MINTNFRAFYSKTRSELASEYGITRKTFYNWLKKEGICIPQGIVRPCDVKKIYRAFGIPVSDRRNYS